MSARRFAAACLLILSAGTTGCGTSVEHKAETGSFTSEPKATVDGAAPDHQVTDAKAAEEKASAKKVAQEKASAREAAEKIVGEWQGVKGWEAMPNISMQFEKDGTFKTKERRGPGLTKDNKQIEAKTVTLAEGCYQIEGRQLTITFKADGKEVTPTRAIKMLTDKVLIRANDSGKTSEYKKK